MPNHVSRIANLRTPALGLGATACLVASLGATNAQTDIAPDLEAVIAAAQEEGELKLAWSEASLGGSAGAERLESEINSKYGTNLEISYFPFAGLARIGGQLATELAAGEPAFTDIWFATAAQIVPMLDQDLLIAPPWAELAPDRMTDAVVDNEGQSVRIATGLSGADYNTQIAPFVPTTLADFLEPEWKGKIATTPYAASFDVLSANDVWGPEKTLDYVTKLSGQVSGMLGCAESERLAVGEYAALVMNCMGQFAPIWAERGAPVARMIPRDAAAMRYYYMSVPKHSENPNAATLFVTYLLSDEGQDTLWELERLDLHSLPGSNTSEEVDALKAEGVEFTEVTVEWWQQHPEIEETTKRIVDILGK